MTAVPTDFGEKRLSGFHTALLGITMLVFFLYFFNLSELGYANLYYAAGVKSMGESWHNFFFASYDGAGFVSIDKPPLGLWIQVIFVKFFGFSGVVLILPQALSAALSVLLIYRITEKSHGKTSGIGAAALMCLMPVFTALARNNTMDMQLILVLLAAAWFLLHGRKRQLSIIFAFVLIGAGFNIKMLQAYMVLPAFLATALTDKTLNVKRRISAAGIGIILMLALSFAWIIAVDLTQDNLRPWVGSSQSNSALELVFGHNGISRIVNPAGDTNMTGQISAVPGESGKPGLFRLFNAELAGQVSWFIPLSAAGLVIALLKPRLSIPRGERRSIMFWLLWAVPMAGYFSSTSGIFHRYYLAVLAPALAILTAVSVKYLYHSINQNGWKRFALPGTVFVSLIFQIFYHLNSGRGWLDFLIFPMVISGLTGVLALITHIYNRRNLFLAAGIILGFAALAIAPLSWSISTVFDAGNTGLPSAGPAGENRQPRGRIQAGDGLPPPLDDSRSGEKPSPVENPAAGTDMENKLTKLINFLTANYSGSGFLAAVPSAMTLGSELMLRSGIPVMALGGFNGRDRIISVQELMDFVSAGKLTYIIAMASEHERPPGNGSRNGMAGPPSAMDASNRELYSFVKAAGNEVSDSVWETGAPLGIEVYRLGGTHEE